ncbi:hypothetical protein [Marinifilum fragile]|uniref:hypothetical protein n=1 Tax=Marinifilum fragile TaxID=570161 RepID=UPI002AA63929|nr:hypothetical protein [Marinifilum fragile]
MNDLFASLYETDLTFNQTYSMELFNNGAYMSAFLSMLLPAFVIMAIFYFLIKYPFCKWYHWFLGICTAIIITGVLTYNVLAETLAVFVLAPNDYPDINSFITTFIVFNVVLAFVTGFIWTLVFKQAPRPNRNVPWGGK